MIKLRTPPRAHHPHRDCTSNDSMWLIECKTCAGIGFVSNCLCPTCHGEGAYFELHSLGLLAKSIVVLIVGASLIAAFLAVTS